jgi:hypothetical protein
MVCWVGLILTLALTLVTATATATPRDDFVVAAYLPEWRFAGVHWEEVSQRVSHLILFSLEIADDGSLTALDRLPDSILATARAATSKFGTRLLVCFGGNGRSAGFPVMVASKRNRERFLNELAAFIDKHKLDGV